MSFRGRTIRAGKAWFFTGYKKHEIPMRQWQETQLKRRGGDVGLKVVSSHGSSYSEDDIEVGMTFDVQF